MFFNGKIAFLFELKAIFYLKFKFKYPFNVLNLNIYLIQRIFYEQLDEFNFT